MAENLFSKHRPLTISQIYGHDTIKKDIFNHIQKDNLPKVIMFSGNAGTGKNTLEKILSKIILCKNKDSEGNPCNVCEQCQTVIKEKVSNYYYLYDGTHIGIDESKTIFEIASKRNLSTVQEKIIVIDEFQGLANTPKALSALLKVFEKPQDHVRFILLTMTEDKLPKDCKVAIQRRGVIYRLKDLTFEEIAKYLYEICNKEGIAINTKDKADTLITISQNSLGSPGLAVSHLERCIYSDLWNPKTVLEELGIVSNETLTIIINKLLSGDVSVFENEINKDIIEKIRWILNILYKSKSGVNINNYFKSCISGIKPIASENIFNTIDKLNKITFFPYISQELIDFTLIDILTSNKKALTSGEPGTKRVRVRVE
jgi:DNA polymerase-3 subunit gamma/tau